MKLRTTKKQIKSNFLTVLSLGYCSVQNLLYYKNPFAYNAGGNGWNCDFYDLGTVCISTGYSPCGIDVDYSIVRDYDKRAEAIVRNNDLSYAEKVEKVGELLDMFLSLVKK